MARVFVDDSGSSAEEPVMYVAGWVGNVPTWDAFADDWENTLAASNPKPIKYFKHYEALARRNCFAGFSESEAKSKMLALAEVTTRHNVFGAVYLVGRQYLNSMIAKYAVTPVHQNLKDPFYICMNGLIGYILGSQYAVYPDDKVDFIFDGKPGSGQANRLIAMYEVCRDVLPEPIKKLMGTAMPMNDKEVLPLQAADLLAGQVRLAMQLKTEDPEPLSLIRRHRPLWVKVVDEEAIRATISYHNFGVSTRRLLTIKRQGEGKKKS